jgi:DNA topoisomerase-1
MAVEFEDLEAARAAGLRYVSNAMPGIRRIGAGKSFRYVDPDGKRVRDATTLARIRQLAVPPAWTDVWICASPNGHLQAMGRDARGRKQYRYHARWRQMRDEAKFERMIAFGKALPRLRRQVLHDLKLLGLPREKIIATIVRLMDRTLIRVGNDEYARENDSYGLTTLRSKHVDVKGSSLRFEFKGKSGKSHSIDVHDPRVARIVKRCRELPGHELFQYVEDDGTRRIVDSEDVNAYLRDAMGEDFTSKDFRTWGATVMCATALDRCGACASETEGKRNINDAVKAVARMLGNTAAVSRKSYIHPVILESYLDGSFGDHWRARPQPTHREDRLRPEEAATLAFLKRQKRAKRRRKAA